jgi:hypothetical protein
LARLDALRLHDARLNVNSKNAIKPMGFAMRRSVEFQEAIGERGVFIRTSRVLCPDGLR